MNLEFLKRPRMKYILPIAAVAFGILGAFALITARDEVQPEPRRVPPPLVRTVAVKLEDHQFRVATQGTVTPHTESALVPEVAGRVVWVSPSLVDGGFFEEGEELFRIDQRDYDLAVTRAEAAVAQADVRDRREQAEAETARREWKELGEGEASPLVLHEPQLAEARAALEAAQATLEQARLNLARTSIRAPYDGRVRSESVDVGQYVTPGAPVGRVYAIDYVEVRLPLPDEELQFADIPVAFQQSVSDSGGAAVELTAEFAGQRHTWKGRIVRTEGELDPASRMIYAVARVDDPYGRHKNSDQKFAPLPIGLFASAEIIGHTVQNVAVLPREVLRQNSRIYVVDENNRLHFREVDVLRADRTEIIIGSGLRPGERVCLSTLDVPTEGMALRTLDGDRDTSDDVSKNSQLEVSP